jgi:hypothetical protein
MADLYSALAEWQGFYEVLAGVAATFAGLLFIGLSLHLELLRRPEFARARSLARHAFSSYMFLALFSLTVLIPYHDWVWMSVAFLAAGGGALAVTLMEIYRLRVWRKPSGVHLPRMRMIYFLSAFVYISVIGAAMLLPRGLTGALSSLVGPLLGHLAWTTLSAWDLLMELQGGQPGMDESTPAA